MPFQEATDLNVRVRELREALGMTQGQFGKLVGRGWRTISEWERGERPPTMRVLVDLAVARGWPVEIFAEGGPRPAVMLATLFPATMGQALPPAPAAPQRARQLLDEAINRVAASYAVPDRPVPWREVLAILAGISEALAGERDAGDGPATQAGAG